MSCATCQQLRRQMLRRLAEAQILPAARIAAVGIRHAVSRPWQAQVTRPPLTKPPAVIKRPR